jgi:DNA invertase Pin-like site-specific DNA recombinase
MARKAVENGKSAVIYIRVSTADQAEHGVSLNAQQERLSAYAVACGLDVVAVVREEGISGTVPLADRPEGSRVAEMVSSGKVRHVIALKLDRLFRSAVDALSVTAQWDKTGIALHLVDMGGTSLNTGSAMGRMLLTMMAGFAQFERDLTAERTTAALAHKKANGAAYSPTPFGKTREGDALLDNEEERGTIDRIRAWREEGFSLRWIASRLNEEGVSTKQGRIWHASTIRYILKNAA